MTRVACLVAPNFLAQLERRRHLTEQRPLLVVEGERVLGACARAAALGVLGGEPLRSAIGRCPDVCVIPAEPAHYASAWEMLVEVLARHSPGIEVERWGLAYVDATGLGRLYGSDESWSAVVRQQVWQALRVKVQLGVAGSKFAAMVAGRSSWPSRIVAVGEDRAYLAPFSVDWLPLDEEPMRRLALLGIHSIGRFAALSAAAVAEQLGAECLVAHRLARGQDDRPVRAQRQRVLEAHVEFEVPETREEPLIATLAAASTELLDDLKRANLAVRRVELEARFADGETATHSTGVGELLAPQQLQRTIRDLLRCLKGDGYGVVEAWLRLIGLEPWVGRQLDLFAHTAGDERREEALRALVRKHSTSVVRACLVDPHTPLSRGHRYALHEA